MGPVGLDDICARLTSRNNFIEVGIEICTIAKEHYNVEHCGVALHTTSGRPLVAIDNAPSFPDGARLAWANDGWVRDPLHRLLRERNTAVGLAPGEARGFMAFMRAYGYTGIDVFPFLIPLFTPKGVLGHVRCTSARRVPPAVQRGLLIVAAAASVRLTQLGVVAEPDQQLERLTLRQRDVAQLSAQGLANQDIADALDLSLNTVKKHLKDVFRRLGIESRGELTALIAASPQLERYPPGITRVGAFTIFRSGAATSETGGAATSETGGA